MATRRTLLAAAALGSLLALTPAAAKDNATPAAASAGEADRANAVYDAIFRELLRHNPEAVTALGLDRTPGGAWAKNALNDRSPAGQAEALARSRAWLAQLDSIDRSRLSGLDAINMDAVRFQLAFSYGVRGLPRPYIVSQQNGAWLDIPDLLRSQHRIETADDAQAYLARLDAFAAALDQETDQIGRDAAAGVIPPDFIIDGTIGLLEQLKAGEAAEHELVGTLIVSRSAITRRRT